MSRESLAGDVEYEDEGRGGGNTGWRHHVWEQQEMGGGWCRAEVPSVKQVVLVGVSLCVYVFVRDREVTSERDFFLSSV